MKILHQCGYNFQWNIQSFEQFNQGDGIILSPVHQPYTAAEELPSHLKKAAVFDPQFYIPNSQKHNLMSYPFFPNQVLNNEFDTSDFYSKAYQTAIECLQFQIENDFSIILIPTRYYSEMHTDYVDRQKQFTVEPFMNALDALKGVNTKPIYISLSLKAPMVEDIGFYTKILNWITSYPKFDGVYLMIDFEETTKQIVNINKLSAYMRFIETLQNAELDVICAYANTEAILYSLLDPAYLTIGAYENTRRFSMAKFLDNVKGRGPAPRLYMPKLLNWVRFQTLEEIRDKHPKLWEQIYTPTTYSESFFTQGIDPHFAKPGVYFHHFETIYQQLNELRTLCVKDRISLIEQWMAAAQEHYRNIEQTDILLFDENCGPGHLKTWNKVVQNRQVR